MEAGVYGLTRGMCLVARRLEVVAVAGLLWTSWCVLDGVDFLFFFVFFDFFSSNAHGLQQVCLIYISTSTDCESCTRPISTKTQDLWKPASMGERVGRVSSQTVSRWSRSPGCCGFRGVFLGGARFRFF